MVIPLLSEGSKKKKKGGEGEKKDFNKKKTLFHGKIVYFVVVLRNHFPLSLISLLRDDFLKML